MDIETLRNWATTLSVLISAGSVVFVWIKTPGEKLKAACSDVADKVEALDRSVSGKIDGMRTEVADDLKKHDRRIQAVEDEMKHLPTSDELNALQVSVTRVEGDVKRIEDTLDRVDHVVGRIDDYLRQNR